MGFEITHILVIKLKKIFKNLTVKYPFAIPL